MKRLLLSAAFTAAVLGSGAANAACGDVTISAFSWQSAVALSYVDQFILSNGFGCNASIVAGDTVPTVTAMIEKGQPDLSPETTPSLLGDVYIKGAAEGRVVEVGSAISDGTVSGWYIPQYVADAHPEIKTVEDAIAHPELFPAPEDPSKGGVIQGPQGWGDTVVTAQLYKALDLDNKGFVLVPSGSAAALDGAIAKAYEQKEGFIAAYWAPTSLLVKYPMVRLEGAHDEAEWARCTSVQDCPDLSTAETKPATGRRKTRPVAGVGHHGARARQIAGAGHGALARRANPVTDDQVGVSSLRARLWPSR